MKNTAYPMAKINLGLYVTARRPDGYHNIETVFYPIPLCDELCVSTLDSYAPSSHIRGTEPNDELVLSGITLQGDMRDNLVMRALQSLRLDHTIPPLRIELQKNIPSGAGLGGGSSDAACMMRMLNEMFSLGLTSEQLEERVGRLGADCAFFIKGQPTMARGIGNEFSPIDVSLKGYHIVLVKPDVFVSTREAYSLVRPSAPAFPLSESLTAAPSQWRHTLFNDFERSVFALHPELSEIKERLYQLGADYACMSGSGSCMFGLFRHQPPSGLEQNFAPSFVRIMEL